MAALRPKAESPPRQQVWEMFDRIAHRYDLLNRLLSFGRDVSWRKQVVRHLPPGAGLRVLDLATGTADVLIALARSGRLAAGVGLDRSAGMLALGVRKIRDRGLADRLSLVQGDAVNLGLRANAFDAVTMAFGIRNVTDMDAGLREMLRILTPGGRALILEFSLPGNRAFRGVYLAYFRHVLPRIGGLLSGDAHAYRYLNQTVETFPYGEAFCEHMRRAGFHRVAARSLTFGIATLYAGEKP